MGGAVTARWRGGNRFKGINMPISIAMVLVMHPAAGAPAVATDSGHVLAIGADGQAALAARFPRFVRAEFVGGPISVCGLATGSGNFALLLVIQQGETALAISLRRTIHGDAPFHQVVQFCPLWSRKFAIA